MPMIRSLLCFGLALSVLTAVTAPVIAQERATPEVRSHGTERAEPVVPRADASGALPFAVPEEAGQAAQLEEPSEVGAGHAVFDEGFWRQVLAGVIVTVVSTLILRAIL